MAYTRLAHRAQALACFLAPTLCVLAFLLFVAHLGPAGLLAGRAVFNDSINKPVNSELLLYEAHILMVPALFALAHLVGQQSPRLAVTSAVMALFGLGTVIAASYLGVHVTTAIRSGFPMNWDFFIGDGFSATEPAGTQHLIEGVCLRNGNIVRCGPTSPAPVLLFVGLPILLYFMAHILLGIGVLRTGALPRWAGVLLIAAALLQFDSNGPQPSGLPLLTGLLSGLCLLVVYGLVGLRLWRGEAETPIIQAHRATA
jgi:hypothetical protein